MSCSRGLLLSGLTGFTTFLRRDIVSHRVGCGCLSLGRSAIRSDRVPPLYDPTTYQSRAKPHFLISDIHVRPLHWPIACRWWCGASMVWLNQPRTTHDRFFFRFPFCVYGPRTEQLSTTEIRSRSMLRMRQLAVGPLQNLGRKIANTSRAWISKIKF